MNDSQKLYDLFKDLLVQLPALFALLGCMIFAVIRWKRNPKVSLMALLSLGLLAVHTLVSDVVYNWVPDWLIQGAAPQNSERTAQIVYLVLGLASNGIVAVGLVWLLTAIFTQRESTNNGSQR